MRKFHVFLTCTLGIMIELRMLTPKSPILQFPDEAIIGWLPHGRAFKIRNTKAFIEKMMQQHFKHTKLTSFQRQLNLYGYKRITRGADSGAYYHELFLRDRPKLCERMRSVVDYIITSHMKPKN